MPMGEALGVRGAADGGNTEAQRHGGIPEMGESKGRWKKWVIKDWVMERLDDAKKAVSPKACSLKSKV